MRISIAILAAAWAASMVSAQVWDIEFSEPVLSPEVSSTRVTLSFEPAAGEALGGIGFDVHADEVGWSDLEALISTPGQRAGRIEGASVLDAAAGYLIHSPPTPGRVAVWAATFTVTDFSPRDIGIAVEAWRYEVYLPPFTGRTFPREIPPVGRGTIQVVPAPAGVALLGLGGLAAARRRR